MRTLTCRHPRSRRGTIIPLLAITVIAIFAFVALAVDIGILLVARTECQNAADTAALSGARMLDNVPSASPTYENNRDEAIARARLAVTENINLNTPFVDDPGNPAASNIESVRIGMYDYDTTAGRFYVSFPTARPTGKSWGAAEVVVKTTQNTFFARVLGVSSLPVAARAVAIHRPRDIALIIDTSGSMANGSKFNWGGGMISPDPLYPKFGHYSRFEVGGYKPYTDGLSNPTNASSPANRAHPLFQTGGYATATNFNPPNNYTVSTRNGPAIVHDYFYDPSNYSTPSTPAFPLSVSAGVPNLKKAFHNWNPAVQSAGDPENYVATTYTYTGYDAFDVTGQYGPLPAPDTFATQADAPGIPYVGDKWPRKSGVVSDTDSWGVATTNGAAVNLAEYLGWSDKYTSGSSLPHASDPPNRGSDTGGFRTVSGTSGQNAYRTDWSDFRDLTWETYGYDLNVGHYVANRGTGFDPRGLYATAQVTAGKFKGYSMGPGYWGKTFFVWPPDPRTPAGDPGVAGYVPGDWRKRYFTSGSANLNNALLNNAADSSTATMTLRSNAPVNYTAILRWLKAPPRVVPPNLRAGRVLYYSSIPDNVNNYTTDPDHRFWREYINYVLGIGSATYTSGTLAEPERMGWPENGSSRVTPAVYTGTLNQYDQNSAALAPPPDPAPYMNYRDNPARPRLNLWFGPQSLMSFISLDTNPVANANWSAATSHESQSWQLKAGISSAVNDIRNNHPNDYVGLCYYSGYFGSGASVRRPMYNVPRSPMAQRYDHIKNALFYPGPLLTAITDSANVQSEVRPYSASDWSFDNCGVIPNGNGSTDPNSGFAQAYNLLSPSNTNPQADPDPTRRGRRGATKIVIFETDGVPNSASVNTYNQQGYNSYYSFPTSLPSMTYYTDGSSSAINPALTLVDEIVAPVSTSATSGKSGFSLPNSQAKVYAIAFGDLFDDTQPSATFKNMSLNFLLDVQKRGKTSPSTASALPSQQVIYGPFQTRIDNLRLALERIMQDGVQVTLIE